MHIATLNVQELKKILKPLAKVINSSTVLPILENLYMHFNGKVLDITVTDLENTVTSLLHVDTKTEFKFTVPFLIFMQTVNNCGAEVITLAYSDQTSRLTISAKDPSFRASLFTESADNYPLKIKEQEWDIQESFSVKELRKPLSDALNFVSNDDLRPSMTGVLFQYISGVFRIVATDAHRLIKKDIITFNSSELIKEVNCIVPRKSCNVLVNLFPEGDVHYKANEKYTFMTGANYTIYARNIDARYPDWKTVWPDSLSYSFVAKRKQMLAMLLLSMPYSNKSTNQICLSISNDTITSEAKDVDFELEFEYNIPAYMPVCPGGEFPQFAMNSKFLFQALRLSKDENIKIQYESTTKAFIFDDDILIMPLMLNNY